MLMLIDFLWIELEQVKEFKSMFGLDKCLRDIKHNIPNPILVEAFKDNEITNANTINKGYSEYNFQTHQSLDDVIYHEVLLGRVIPDCNMIGGEESFILLKRHEGEVINNATMMYYLTDAQRQNRDIISPLSVSYLTSISNDIGAMANTGRIPTQDRYGDSCSGGNNIINQAKALLASMQPLPVMSDTKLKLVGRNLLKVTSTSGFIDDMLLHCLLGNAPDMSNLSPGAMRHFSKLAVLACKAFCYNKLLIRVNKGIVQNGVSMGVFKDVLDSYSEANELYEDYLETRWQKVAFCDDRPTYQRFIALQIPRR